MKGIDSYLVPVSVMVKVIKLHNQISYVLEMIMNKCVSGKCRLIGGKISPCLRVMMAGLLRS